MAQKADEEELQVCDGISVAVDGEGVAVAVVRDEALDAAALANKAVGWVCCEPPRHLL